MADNRALMISRACFVYEAARLLAQVTGSPVVPAIWAERENDFKSQFVDVVAKQCGPERSFWREDLHESWVQVYVSNGWVYGEEYDPEKRIHPDLVSYSQLTSLESDKDAVFILLCEIARLYIR